MPKKRRLDFHGSWREWIRDRGIEDVAYLVNKSPATVRNWVYADTWPTLDNVLKILAISNYELCLRDFLHDEHLTRELRALKKLAKNY